MGADNLHAHRSGGGSGEAGSAEWEPLVVGSPTFSHGVSGSLREEDVISVISLCQYGYLFAITNDYSDFPFR